MAASFPHSSASWIVKEHRSHLHPTASVHFHPSESLHAAGDHHHHSSEPHLRLPVQLLQVSPSLVPSPNAMAMKEQASSMIPSPTAPSQTNTASPSFTSSVSDGAAALPRHISLCMDQSKQHSEVAEDGSMACRQTSDQHPASVPQFDHLNFQHQKAELQLLPTSELRSNHRELSPGSENLGKDVTSASSTSRAPTYYCSPRSKTVDGKKAGADNCQRMLLMPGAVFSSVDAPPCKLQLSIGLSYDDHFAYSENRRLIVANQEENSETKEVSVPSLPWNELQGDVLVGRNDPCHGHTNIETPKSFSSLCSTTDAKQVIASSTDTNKDAVDLDLASSMWLNQQYKEVRELLQATKRWSHRASMSEGAEKAKLLHCSSVPDQCASLSGSIEETDRVPEVLQQTDFSRAPASDMQAALQALVEEAREKLRRASEEKLEAEKAWIEARREREQAEEERAKAQRIAEFSRMVALGDGRQEEARAPLGKAICSSSTMRSSPSLSSIANCQGSAASFQVVQLREGRVLCTAPSFVACPSCHHISQILYSPPNRTMGTALVGSSPLELAAPPRTLTTPCNSMLPSSSTQISS